MKGGQPTIQNGNNGKGYVITAHSSADKPFIYDALHVEMDTESWRYNDDYEAAQAAQQDGIKLVYGIPFVEDGVYLDTPENRLILDAYSQRMREAIEKKQQKS